MALENDLLEFYREHREEVDILTDEKAFFVLAFLRHLGNASWQELSQHLGWDSNKLAATCIKLRDAGMINIQNFDDPATHIHVLSKGIDLLRMSFDAPAVSPIKQNLIRCIDFSDYEKELNRLCESIEVNYSPFSKIPRDIDFQSEIYKVTSLDIRDSQRLIDEYAFFRNTYDQNKELAELLLTMIIGKCQDFNIPLISPYLALGVLRAEAGRHEDALKTFLNASAKFLDDPRVWAGIAGAQYHLGCYEDARNSYEKCRSLVIKSNNENYKSHMAEVVHNLAYVLDVLGHQDHALRELNDLPEPERQRPEMLTLKGKILMNAGDLSQALATLEKAYERCELPSVFLLLALSDCYERCGNILKQYEILDHAIKSFPNDTEICRSLASYFVNRGEWEQAFNLLKKAVSLSPHEIKYRAELALLSYSIGNLSDFDYQVEKILTLPAINHTEHYYLGLICHLIGKLDRGLDEYSYAKRDRRLASWPYYDKLVSK